MAKKLLTYSEIKELCHGLVMVYRLSQKFEGIQNPKTPPVLSESVVLTLLQQKNQKIIPKLSEYEFKSGNDPPDILAEHNGDKKRIEVKGTNWSRFQFLSKSDINAYCLLWVDFGTSFIDHDLSAVSLFVFNLSNCKKQYPELWKKYKERKGKLHLHKIVHIVKDEYTKWKIDLTGSKLSAKKDNTVCVECGKDLWEHKTWNEDGSGKHSKQKSKKS